MKKTLICLLSLILLGACSLSASQEQELNKQTGIYLDAQERNALLVVVSKTHPSFVRYAKSKGESYFKNVFENEAGEELVFINPMIRKIESKGDHLQVLYEVEKEYIQNGENHRNSSRFVALSDDEGKTWYFLDHATYANKKICRDIPRLLK
ncbi:MAG: hypothetical protein K0R65_1582 [Crocinitomicaceae bacterium]|jgi:hypothetical protein|nr:hypothetical protein [Crocinitomicaceae bacterium]